MDVRHNGKVFLHIWKVTEVVPTKKISYEWKFGDYPGNPLVSFELFNQDGKTRIICTHSGMETFDGESYPDPAKPNFIQGWTHFIGSALKDYVEQIAEPQIR